VKHPPQLKDVDTAYILIYNISDIIAKAFETIAGGKKFIKITLTAEDIKKLRIDEMVDRFNINFNPFKVKDFIVTTTTMHSDVVPGGTIKALVIYPEDDNYNDRLYYSMTLASFFVWNKVKKIDEIFDYLIQKVANACEAQ